MANNQIRKSVEIETRLSEFRAVRDTLVGELGLPGFFSVIRPLKDEIAFGIQDATDNGLDMGPGRKLLELDQISAGLLVVEGVENSPPTNEDHLNLVKATVIQILEPVPVATQ